MRESGEAVSLGFPIAQPFGGGNPSIAGRVRVENGRFRNDKGFLGVRAITEFSVPYLCQHFQLSEVERRLDRAAGARRNCARYLMMAKNLFQLSPWESGWWDAQNLAVEFANERGMYAEMCLFADAQDVIPKHEDRKALVREYAGWCREQSGVIPQLTNEPWKNGFESATDPKLLELAEIFAGIYGSRDFAIGDPMDIVEDEQTGEPLGGELEKLSAHCNILQIHGDRTVDPSRYARWVDHLKGITDFRGRAALRSKGFGHDEPMGMASVFEPGRRDNRAEALVAAAVCCAIFQVEFCTHYISEQDDTVPGLQESSLAADIPHGPEWEYLNTGIGQSPVVSFTGFEKARTCTNGSDAWVCAWGHQKGTLEWGNGYSPTEKVFNGVNVEVWKARR